MHRSIFCFVYLHFCCGIGQHVSDMFVPLSHGCAIVTSLWSNILCSYAVGFCGCQMMLEMAILIVCNWLHAASLQRKARRACPECSPSWLTLSCSASWMLCLVVVFLIMFGPCGLSGWVMLAALCPRGTYYTQVVLSASMSVSSLILICVFSS